MHHRAHGAHKDNQPHSLLPAHAYIEKKSGVKSIQLQFSIELDSKAITIV